LHAETTALMTRDDHEVQNDYADRWSQTFDDPQKFFSAAPPPIKRSTNICRCARHRVRTDQ
jgi:hypothetical protein